MNTMIMVLSAKIENLIVYISSMLSDHIQKVIVGFIFFLIKKQELNKK